jgi:hypothetical protein
MPFGPPPAGLQRRLRDWEERLRDLVSRHSTKPFSYELHDCVSFASRAVFAVTGVTLLPGVVLPRGRSGVASFLSAHDLENVEELAIAALGILPGDPDLARPGDLVLHTVEEEQRLAVRVDDGALMPANTGLVAVERSAWMASWAIGWDGGDLATARSEEQAPR